MAHAFERPHDVEGGIPERRRGVIGLLYGNSVRKIAHCDDASCALHLRAHWSDPNDSRTALLSQPYAAAANPTTGIEHPVTGMNGGDLGEHSVRVKQGLRVRTTLLVVVPEVDRIVVAVEPQPSVGLTTYRRSS